MPFNGSGTYELPTGSIIADGSTADATDLNTPLQDIETALSQTFLRDGSVALTGSLDMDDNQITNLLDGTSKQHAATVVQLQKNVVGWTDAGGTANSITASYTPAIANLQDGVILGVRAANANTSTTPDFSPNGLTARTITKHGNSVLIPGDIAGSGHELLLRYKATGTRWELLNPAFGPTTIEADVTFKSTDGGAGAGPVVEAYRDSSSPANSDVLGNLQYSGRNSAASKTIYASIRALIADVTAATEDAVVRIMSMTAGTLSSVVNFGAGIYTPSATGGDKGVDTINAGAYYSNGVLKFSEVIKAASETVSGSTSLQADDELTFAMAANTRYEFEFSLYYDTTAAADFKFDLDSSGATDPGDMNIAIEYLAPAATAWVSTVYTTLNNVISITAGAGSGQIKIGGYAANGADAGSLRVRWAQNTSDPGNTVVRRSSSLRYRVT